MDIVCDAFETITIQESQVWKSSSIPLNALIFNLNVFITCYEGSFKGYKTLVDQFNNWITESIILNY